MVVSRAALWVSELAGPRVDHSVASRAALMVATSAGSKAGPWAVYSVDPWGH